MTEQPNFKDEKQAAAQQYLEGLGYGANVWASLKQERNVGHLVVAMVLVAEGDERELVDIYNEQRIATGDVPVSRKLAQELFPTTEEFIAQFERSDKHA